jgi:LPXTG-motif cell wall-anchored protein
MSSILFSQVPLDIDQVAASWKITSPTALEHLIIFGAIGLVTLLLVLWAIFLRKRRRRRREHHHEHRHSSTPADVPETPTVENAPAPPKKRRHHRRSRYKDRARNPTLAETGGLPPIRPEDAPGSQP